jgi:hypothetical protein
MPAREFSYEECKDVGINMDLVESIKPLSFTSCALIVDGCAWWIVNGSMEDVVRFMNTGCLSFSQWKGVENDANSM